jgi:archaea-specific DNA-binding protein
MLYLVCSGCDELVNEEGAQAENVVFIGKKAVMNYVTACITFFNSGETQVVVKARGRAICSAVDTVELLRRAFVQNLEIRRIAIDTEELARDDGGQKSNISVIEIVVAKAEPEQPQEED